MNSFNKVKKLGPGFFIPFCNVLNLLTASKRPKNRIYKTQSTFTYLKSVIETIEKGVKYVQS